MRGFFGEYHAEIVATTIILCGLLIFGVAVTG